MASKSFTHHLSALDRSALVSATQHAFLLQAGLGTLSDKALCEWLVQDKYYQVAYTQFIGRLVAKVNLEPYAFPDGDGDGGKGLLEWRIFKMLVQMLNAMQEEVEFYDTTVEKYELELKPEGAGEAAVMYKALFEESSQASVPLSWGLTVLWATEFCYLQAWSFAKSHQGQDVDVARKVAVAALHNEFFPHWTSDGFRDSVDEMAEVLDQYVVREPGEEKVCQELWLRVLELEEKFWPRVLRIGR